MSHEFAISKNKTNLLEVKSLNYYYNAVTDNNGTKVEFKSWKMNNIKNNLIE